MIFLLFTLGVDAGAQVAEPVACPPKAFRFEEDCSDLRGHTLTGLDSLRYVSLDADGDWWLQFGGQYRFRLEHLDEPNYGVGGIPGYTAEGNRILGSALLRSSAGFMLFAELGVATERGRKPVERSFDRSALDLTQGFVELPADLGEWRAALRLGRQELDSEGNRLLSAREVSNLRRTFDMALGSMRDATHEIEVFSGRPVINFRGAFDDHWSTSESLNGVMGTWRPIDVAPISSAGFFYFDRSLNRLVSPADSVRERRRTFGLRSNLEISQWDGAAQASWQWGSQGERNIRAYGIAGELGRTWMTAIGRARAGISFGWASGDAAPERGAVGRFDVLYPSLDYFTDAPLSYPGNTTDIRPTLRWWPVPAVSVQGGADRIWRIDRADAVLAPPGVPLIAPGQGSGGRIVTLVDLRATWHFLPCWELLASVVRGNPGPVLDPAGARDATFLLFQLTGKI
ncbi:MAG TPA: alginate export family protein [Steroidobacteraceae bacterium]